MSIKPLLLITAWCLLASGCRLGSNLARTTIIEPIQFAQNLDNQLEDHRYRRLAEKAFEAARALARAEADDYQHEPFSDDLRGGFLDGYVDYLEAGGTGQPPPMPPRRYWKAVYQSPQGQLAVQDWFCGFAFGAEMAKVSGQRDLVTIPLSDAIVWTTQPWYHRQQPAEEPVGESADTDEPEVVDANRSFNTAQFAPKVARLPPITSAHAAEILNQTLWR